VKTDLASEMLTAALAYALRGWRVFPVKPTSAKTPLIKNWPKVATTNAEQIWDWWSKWPHANVGIVTDSVVVLDVDNHHGAYEGLRSLQEFGELPVTPTATTPSGGMHLFFVGSGNTRVGIRPGLDIRANRGFVVAPPSTDERGAYVWRRGLSPKDVPLARVPVWLAELMAHPVPRVRSTEGAWSRSVAGPIQQVFEGPIHEGTRHSTLVSLGARLRHYGATFDDIVAHLLATNAARCTSPLPKEEVTELATWCASQPSFAQQYAVLDRAWTEPRKSGVAATTDFLVMRGLIDVARRAQSIDISVSSRRLASRVHREPKTVRRALARLVNDWHVTVRPGLPGRASHYQLRVPEPEAAHDEGAADDSDLDLNDQAARDWLLQVAFPRRWNAVRILRELYTPGVRSASELASELNVSAQTVRENLAWLTNRSIICRDGDGWSLPEFCFWRILLDPETDFDAFFTMIIFYADNVGTLAAWNKRQHRMNDEVTRYDEFFRRRFGKDRRTGEILSEEATP
jgi:Bifunctional DNA primase/polymerase, N-terminal